VADIKRVEEGEMPWLKKGQLIPCTMVLYDKVDTSRAMSLGHSTQPMQGNAR
jgi:hypothetical protein